MKFISHRGNINGPNKAYENTEEYINSALSLGYDCEVDIWVLNDQLWLGHDYPQYQTTYNFIENNKNKLWIHCKNIDALIKLKESYNCFFHDKDLYTLTTMGFIWGNINSPVIEDGILVMPEKSNVFNFKCFGICSDFPNHYKTIYESTYPITQ